MSEMKNIKIEKEFNKIIDNAHFWNWAPDWEIAKNIYLKIPDSYSILTPFAYSYLEELIRSTTSEYGISFLNRDGKKNNIRVGMGLIKLAKDENADKPEYIKLLDKTKKYFQYEYDNPHEENGRNKVVHGHLHPRFWTKEAFELLIHDIAEMSEYAGF